MNAVKMFILLLSLLLIQNVQCEETTKHCDGFSSPFDALQAIGTWHVVAVIPHEDYVFVGRPKCFHMNLTLADEHALKWLMKQRFGKRGEELIDDDPGEILRLRYNVRPPLDIWSKAYKNEEGCYKQLIDIKDNDSILYVNKSLNSPMLLRILQTNSGPFLFQLLWGRFTAIIYFRKPEILTSQLREIFEFLTLFRPVTKVELSPIIPCENDE